jgi:hypothetical protein
MKNEEHLEQCAFFDWLKLACPAIYEVTFAIPNGGKRDIRTAIKLKKEGVKPGVPDIFIAHPIFNRCGGSFIEMKSKKGKLSVPQKDMIKVLTRNDHFYVCVAYGWEKARDFVMAYYWNRCHTIKSLEKCFNMKKADILVESD